MLARVAARVVDGDRGTGDQLLGEGQLLLVERLGLLRAPEVDHAHHQVSHPHRNDDQRVDPVLHDLRGALQILREPPRSLPEAGLDHGLAGADAAGLGRGRDEPDPLAHRIERSVLADTAERRTAQIGARLRLLAAQHGVGQVHGDVVREPRYRHLGQFLGGTGHVQARTDAHPGVVQELEMLPGHFGLAGQRAQLGRVSECRDAAGRAALEVRGPLVDRQQPVADQVHLVRRDAPRGQEGGRVRVEAEFEHMPSLGVPGKVQQPVRLVVGEQQAPLAAGDHHAFPDRVQHRVVMLVHPGHLERAQPVCLAQQPSAHQRRPAQGQGECRGGCGQQERKLPVRDTADVLGGDARRHQAHDLAVVRLDGNHGLHQRPDGSRDLLGEGAALQRRFQGSDELLADPVGLGVGVADPVGVHHHDEVHLGPLAGRFGPRLKDRGGIGGTQGVAGAGSVGERLGDGQGAVRGLLGAVVPHLQDQGHHRGHDQQQHDHHLQDKYLARDTAPAQPGP